MRKLSYALLVGGWLVWACPLRAQQPCPSFSIMIDSPEDKLTLAIINAENPQEQVAALDSFVKENPGSKFMPCVYEYYTSAYLKLSNNDKVIEYGEKDLAENYQDLNLMLNLARAYSSSGKASDAAFDIILKIPDQIKAESNPSRPAKATDQEWQKMQQELVEQSKSYRETAASAFFALLQRLTDGKKAVDVLDRFAKVFPEEAEKDSGRVNFNYFLAYKLANDAAKADECGEKAIAADSNNAVALNLVADYYASRQTNLDKAEDYARKALEVAPSTKKPEGISDDQFTSYRNSLLGMAHLTLGYVAFLKGAKTRKVGPAIQEFKAAADLLSGDPEHQAKTLYLLGYAYEVNAPVDHKSAAEALTRASSIASPWQAPASELLAKVKKAMAE
jgi:tetratricopeptide (TPR) repeat protein